MVTGILGGVSPYVEESSVAVVTADSLPVSADLAPWSDVHDDVMAIPNMDISSA